MSSPSSKSPKPKRHRPKFKLESIHVEELLSASGMSGFLGVLDQPKETPHLERLADEMLAEIRQSAGRTVPDRYQDRSVQGITDTGVHKTGIPIAGIPLSGSAIKGAPTQGVPFRSAGIPHSGVPETGAPGASVTVQTSDFPAPIVRRRQTIRPALLVQDGHSLGEQRVYQTLWDHAQPYQSDTRIIAIGYRSLSDLCGLAVNNCKANLEALSRKLAIEEFRSHTPTHAKTYIVHNYSAILRRRKAAGLTHVIKTKGVSFVNPLTGAEVNLIGPPVSGIPVSISGAPFSGTSGTPVSAALSLDNSFRQSSPPASSSVAAIVKLLYALGIAADDDVARQLIQDCRAVAPDATISEIEAFLQLKYAQIDRDRIRNPIGFLLAAVPKCFEPLSLDAFRSRDTQGGEVASDSLNPQVQEELMRMATDPDAAAEDRRFALRILNTSESSET